MSSGGSETTWDRSCWEGLREPVSIGRSWCRKIDVLARITKAGGPALSADEMARDFERRCSEARSRGCLSALMNALWAVEHVAFRHFEQGGEASLRGEDLVPETGPPAHCGLAMASVLRRGFDHGAIRRDLAERSDPRFVFFAYESVGAALGMYQRDLLGHTARRLGRWGWIRHEILEEVDTGAFFANWEEPEQKLMAHGFGRLAYFKSHGFRRTLRYLVGRPEVPLGGAIRGAVAALGLVNFKDLGRVFEMANRPVRADIREALDGGLRNLVLLLEWSSPGVLAEVPFPDRAHDLVAEATTFAHRAREAGEGPQLVA